MFFLPDHDTQLAETDLTVAMCVFSIGTYAVNSVILAWVSATCSQTKEKKASALAIVNCIAVSSFIWTPYMVSRHWIAMEKLYANE